jgi:hypothetical protein
MVKMVQQSPHPSQKMLLTTFSPGRCPVLGEPNSIGEVAVLSIVAFLGKFALLAKFSF